RLLVICSCSCHSPPPLLPLPSFPTRRSSDLFSSLSGVFNLPDLLPLRRVTDVFGFLLPNIPSRLIRPDRSTHQRERALNPRRERSEEHTSELQSRFDLVCRLLLEKKKQNTKV